MCIRDRGISYRADIRKAKAVINSLIEANDRIIKDKEYRIFVDDLGASSVVIGMRFWTKTEDYLVSYTHLSQHGDGFNRYAGKRQPE